MTSSLAREPCGPCLETSLEDEHNLCNDDLKHGWRECTTKGNVDWMRIYGESDPKEKTIPEKDQQ